MATTPAAITRAIVDALAGSLTTQDDAPTPFVSVYAGEMTAQRIGEFVGAQNPAVLVMPFGETGVSRTTLCGVQETRQQYTAVVLVVLQSPALQQGVVDDGEQSAMALERQVVGALSGLYVDGAWCALPLRFLNTLYAVRRIGELFVGAHAFAIEYVMDLDTRRFDIGEPFREMTLAFENPLDTAVVSADVELAQEADCGCT